MKKYRPPLTEIEKQELVRLSNLDFSNYSETDVREEFLVELLKILGYRKELDYSVSREESYNLHPFFLSVGSKRIKLDYLCSLRKQYFWLLEAKNGNCDDKTNPPQIQIEEIQQAYFYSLHSQVNCNYFLVSNGWFTNLYNRDELDENATPILSIKSSEITKRFLEIDAYIGATQILPFLKERILDQIQKTLASEIVVDRLDEFSDEVNKVLSKIKPLVQRNGWDIYHKREREIKGGISDVIRYEDLYRITYAIFQSPMSLITLEGYSKIILERLTKNQIYGTQGLFFHKLLLNEPYPVSYWYYSSVLYLLFYLQSNGFEEIHSFGPKKKKTIEYISDWVDLCLFHLSKRKELRILWAFEAIFYRLSKRFIIMIGIARNSMEDFVKKKLFLFPEEDMAALGHPSPAGELIEMIERISQVNRNLIFDKYYDKRGRKFKVSLALQDYRQTEDGILKFEQSTEMEYQKIKEELGDKWAELLFYDSMNKTFDKMGSAICNIMTLFPDLVKEILTEPQKRRIKLLAKLKCTNFADKLCELLNIDLGSNLADEYIKQKRIELFNPAVNQYEMTI